ncbi:MAG TPA: hypothetical protein VF528_14480 [Pyrinomonadaceae bacterium]|jgi:hypothetical protein
MPLVDLSRIAARPLSILAEEKEQQKDGWQQREHNGDEPGL